MPRRVRARRPRDIRCPSGKRSFCDHVEATDALRNTQRIREEQLRRLGVTRRKECRVYACPNCGGWHLTSRA